MSELNKPLEFTFDRDNKECGKLYIKIESQHLISKYETEKWFELETTEPSSAKLAAKVHILIFKLANDSRSKTPKKIIQPAESLSADNSPRVSYINKKLQERSGKTPERASSRVRENEYLASSQNHPLTKSTVESIRASPQTTTTNKEGATKSYARILTKYPELKLNLNGTIHGLLGKISQRNSAKGSEQKPQSRPSSKQETQNPSNLPKSKRPSNPQSNRESIKEMQSYTHRGEVPKKPNRKTKSLEKFKVPFPIPNHEKTYDNDKDTDINREINSSTDFILDTNQNVSYYRKRCESLELEHNLHISNQKELKQQLIQANKKFEHESSRFEEVVKYFEQVKENYESHYRRLHSQIDQYERKCYELERMLQQSQNEAYNQKKDVELKGLYEKEITTLREIIDEQKAKHFQIEEIIEKKSEQNKKLLEEIESEKASLKIENVKLEEAIRHLKDENMYMQNRNDALKLENTTLKSAIQKYEMQDEFIKELRIQRESHLKEIEKLRVTNHYLLDLKEQHSRNEKERCSIEQEEHRLGAIDLKKIHNRINHMSNMVTINYENINQYLLNNKALKEKMDEVVDILEIKEFSEDEEGESPIYNKLFAGEVDSIETHIDKNIQIIHKIEENTDILEKFVFANHTTRGSEIDSFEKVLTRPDSKSSGSKTDTLFRSFNLKTDKPTDSFKKSPYFALKDDMIDIKLGDFINTHKEGKHLAQLFKRKSYGVYLFGSKRIYLKLEHGKLCVKVGALYQPLEKYIFNSSDPETKRPSSTAESLRPGTKKGKNLEYFS